VVISPTVAVLGDSLSLSRMEKAIVEACSCGCAEAWQGVGSMDLKLRRKSAVVCAFLDSAPTLFQDSL
jgi:hypothetical protein